jgi:hypothetical protein
VLIGGDVGQECLDFWDEEELSPSAQILVFPHHGGVPGSSDVTKFAAGISARIAPDVVIFSIHRNRFNLPREDVIASILNVRPKAKLLCTQLPNRILAGGKKLTSGTWSLHCLTGRSLKKWWDGHIAVFIEAGVGTVRSHCHAPKKKMAHKRGRRRNLK